MPTVVTPFVGLRYNPRLVPRLEEIMTPPYDAISDEERSAYMARSPYNMIHLILGTDHRHDTMQNNRFTRAAALLQQWRRIGVLVPEARPALYLSEQEFMVRGTRFTRTGFIARVRLADYQAGIVFPHEQTFPAPKAHLLRLWRACRANLSQIFAVYLDTTRRLETIFAPVKTQPPQLVVPDGIGGQHRLWVVMDPEIITRVQHAMRDRPLIIADGHHRYEAALTLRDEMRRDDSSQDATAPYEYVMMYCANVYDAGMLILPTHRLVQHLPLACIGSLLQRLPWVRVEVDRRRHAGESLRHWQRRLETILHQRQGQGSTFAMYAGGDCCHIVTVARQYVRSEGRSDVWNRLDASVLHEALLPALQALVPASRPKIAYARANDEVLQAVQDGDWDLAVLMHPPSLETVTAIAMQGERMPQKSTCFYPKLPTGLVVNSFDV